MVLFTDTDSLVYEIETSGVYEDFYVEKKYLALVNIQIDSKFYDATTEKVFDKMKDGTKGVLNCRVCGIKIKGVVVRKK